MQAQSQTTHKDQPIQRPVISFPADKCPKCRASSIWGGDTAIEKHLLRGKFAINLYVCNRCGLRYKMYFPLPQSLRELLAT